MTTFQSLNSNKHRHLAHNNQTLPIDLEQEIQSILKTTHCSFPLPHGYKLMAAEHAVEALINDNLTADIALYTAIERQEWEEVNRIYQKVFRPHLEAFAEETLFKLLNKQVA